MPRPILHIPYHDPAGRCPCYQRKVRQLTAVQTRINAAQLDTRQRVDHLRALIRQTRLVVGAVSAALAGIAGLVPLLGVVAFKAALLERRRHKRTLGHRAPAAPPQGAARAGAELLGHRDVTTTRRPWPPGSPASGSQLDRAVPKLSLNVDWAHTVAEEQAGEAVRETVRR